MTLTVEPNYSILQEQSKKLAELGFVNYKKNLKLLTRSRGNLQVVINFLEAKKKLKEASFKRKFHSFQISSLCSPIVKDAKIEHNQVVYERSLCDPSSIEVLIPNVPEDPKIENKHAERLRRKTERALKKEQKYLLKTQFKEEKKQFKFQKRSEKKFEKKSEKKHEKKPKEDKSVSVNQEQLVLSWPSVDQVFLDGNNMLYVTGPIRSLVLGRSCGKAEEALTKIARAFGEVMGVKCTLIFDDTATSIVEEGFVVCSARPGFTTSDDALVHFQVNGTSSAGSSLYVTSDRGLDERLQAAGGLIYKPKQWFYLAAKVLGGNVQTNQELDMWIAEFIKPQ